MGRMGEESDPTVRPDRGSGPRHSLALLCFLTIARIMDLCIALMGGGCFPYF